MRGVARLTDIAVGLCFPPCHIPIPVPWIGIIESGSPDVFTNNLETARLTDIVIGCHPAFIVTGDETVLTNNLPTARHYDICIGPCPTIGVIITCSPDVFCK